MTDNSKSVDEDELMGIEVMARLEGIVGPGDVVSYTLVDLAQMQALGLPYTRPLGALILANEPGTGIRTTYATELDRSPEGTTIQLPAFRCDGWPTERGWVETPRKWKACDF